MESYSWCKRVRRMLPSRRRRRQNSMATVSLGWCSIGLKKANLTAKTRETRMRHKQRQDEQRHAGANPAAFLSHFNIDPWKMKDQTFTQDRDAEKVKKGFRYPSGTRLKQTDQPVQKEIG